MGWRKFRGFGRTTPISKEVLENEVKPLVEQFLQTRGLELSQEKTRTTDIHEGFDFLGWNVRKYNGTFLIKPSIRNVKTFLDKIRGIIRGNKTARPVQLINQLNPIIRGWANYHKTQVAKKTFASVDKETWKALWQWAKRRHLNKGIRWIKNKYFKSIGTRTWVFAAQSDHTELNGTPKILTLIKASDTTIKRHTKIVANANPFDPKWERYFEGRKKLKIRNSDGNKRMQMSWKGWKTCPI